MQASLRRAVHEYIEHYDGERNHQGLENRLLLSPTPMPPIAARSTVMLVSAER
jgi:hypothetical protein